MGGDTLGQLTAHIRSGLQPMSAPGHRCNQPKEGTQGVWSAGHQHKLPRAPPVESHRTREAKLMGHSAPQFITGDCAQRHPLPSSLPSDREPFLRSVLGVLGNLSKPKSLDISARADPAHRTSPESTLAGPVRRQSNSRRSDPEA